MFVDIVGAAAAADRVRRGRHRGARCARWRATPVGSRTWSTRARGSRPASASPTPRRSSPPGPRRRSAARRDRPGDLDRGPHPRPQARRRGAADRAALAGAVHRRDGLQAGAGQAPRAAARRRLRRRGARADVGPARARPRRGQRRGDRAVDPGRGRGRAPRPRGRTAGERQGPHPRGRRLDRGPDPGRRRRDALRRASPSCWRRWTGARWWSTRSVPSAMSTSSSGSWSCSARTLRELRDRVDFGRAQPVVCEDWSDGPGCVAALRSARRSREPTR